MSPPGGFAALAIGMVLGVLIPRGASGESLEAQRLGPAPSFQRGQIVGRARCGDVIRMITEYGEWLGVTLEGRPLATRKVTGGGPERQWWGLGCLADGSAWTLSSSRTLVRVEPDGVVSNRLTLPTPWIGLFGVVDQLVFAGLPPQPGRGVLSAVRLPDMRSVRQWPGLQTRPVERRADLVPRNLVNCGLDFGGVLPCWFADDTSVFFASATSVQRQQFSAVRTVAFDPEVPLHDVASVQGGAWLLVTSPHREDGRRVGRLIIFAERPTGAIVSKLALQMPARLILWATDRRCVLLTTAGELLEVRRQ